MPQKQPFQLTSIRNILTLRYDPDKPTLEKRLSPRDFREINYREDVVEKVEAILKNQIRRLGSKSRNITVPMGSGVDSAVVLTLAKQVFPDKNIRGVSLSFNDSQDETGGAMKICSALDVECYTANIDNVLQKLPLLVSIVGEPRWNLWYYYALEAAKKLGTDTMLTGDGGDELFAGYVFRYSKYLSLTKDAPSSDWSARAWSYLQCHERDWVPDQEKIFGPRMSGVFDWKMVMKYLKPYFDNSMNNKLVQVFLADYNGKLIYDWIPTNAKLSKYFNMRTSSPFLTEAMSEYAPHIPMSQKYDEQTQEGKLILRSILDKHGILPRIAKKKMGFGMELENLWDKHGREIAERYLEKPTVSQEGLISEEWLNQTMASLRKKKDPRYINKVLQILSLEIWYRIFIAKDISPERKLNG